MRFLRNLPISGKLTLITMLTSCLALALACLAFVGYEQMVFRNTLVSEVLSTAAMVGHGSAAGLSFNDPASTEQALQSLSARPHIIEGAVYDKNGVLFAQYQRTAGKGSLAPPHAEPDGCRFGAGDLELFRRFDLGGENIGTVYIRSDLGEMRARLRRYLMIVGIVGIAASLAAFLFSRKLQSIVSRPIAHLAEVVSVVAAEKGYGVRAVKQSEDELGRLIDGFNEMLEQIQTRDRALQEARDGLEDRVEERTRELQLEIAERKQVEQALRASEEQIRLILNTAFDAIVTCDARGSILEWNAQAEKSFGWLRAEVLGRNLTETIIPPGFREAHRRGLEHFVATGEALVINRRIEINALHKTGVELPIELAISPVCVNGTYLFSAFLRDIRERRDAEAKLEAAHRKLLEASRQAGMAEVATSVLHNVGNVLNSVNVSASLVSDKIRRSRLANLTKLAALLEEHVADLASFLNHDPKGRHLPGYLSSLARHLTEEQKQIGNELETLAKSVEHIKEIVAMQQSYARVSGVLESLSAAELVDDGIRMNAAALARHRVEVARDFAEVPKVWTERHKVLQILVNLIRNAKYACDDSGRADKRILIRIHNGDGKVKISVTDNGVGIPSENLSRVFNHGFTTRRGGHGFGLHSGALAAREMGGALTAQSDGSGRGATFTLELPIKL